MVPEAQPTVRRDTTNLVLIRAVGGRATHVKSEVGMWPSCRYDAKYGSRTVKYAFADGAITCRWCRQTHNLMAPGERPVTRSS